MQIDSLRAAQSLTMTQASITPAQRPVDQPELIQAVSALNQSGFFGENYELNFDMDRASHRPLLQLVDKETREIVRQLPPEYALRMARQLKHRG